MRPSKGTVRAFGFLAAAALALPGVGVAAERAAPPRAELPRYGFVPGEIVLRFEREATAAMQRRVLRAIDGRIAATIDGLRIHRVELAGLTPSAAVRVASRFPGVDFAERNRTGRIAAEILPNDRCFGTGCGIGRLWNLDAINAPAGWQVFPGTFYGQAAKAALAAPVKIAVLDTQIDYSRSDWVNANAGTISNGFDSRSGGQIAVADAADFVTNRNHAGGAAYHGTFVAGLLGASANNSIDVAGVAYHARIVPIAVVDGNGGVTAFDLASGIDHATDVGARVINMSLGMLGPDRSVEIAIAAATRRQAILVAAAGNNGNDAPFYPAWYSGVMSVTATDAADRPANCTNHSPRTSVAAPGAGIIGLDPRAAGGMSLVVCGTSTATPHVSGLAALLVAQHPTRTAHDIRRIIEETADDDRFSPGRDEYFGAGRINVERALRFGQPLPRIAHLAVAIPPNAGGAAPSKATAVAESSTPILAAEWFLDRMGPPGSGTPMTAVDGAFDESTEELSGSVNTTIQRGPGVYRVFVRARNANGWGAATTGALIVDRSPPTVTIDQADHPAIAASGIDAPATVSVRMADDYGIDARVTSEIRSAVDGRFVTEGPETTAKFGSTIAVTWRPAALTVGLYDFVVNVTDEAGNTGRATRRIVVV